MNPRKTLVLSVAIATTLAGLAVLRSAGRSCSSMAALETPVPLVSVTEQAVAPVAVAEEAESSELKKVRQAAIDCVRETLPGSKTDGVFTHSLTCRGEEAVYVAGVDTRLSDGSRVTVDLLVRKYVRKNGASYWRAERLGRSAAEMILRDPCP